MTAIICSRCKTLVDVVDRQIALHDDPATGERCALAGSRYVPQKPKRTGTGRPRFKLLGVEAKTFQCDKGHTHQGLELHIGVSGGNPNWN